MSKKRKPETVKDYLPRLPIEAVEKLSKGDTIVSKKVYRRKGRGVRKALTMDIEDQIKNSDLEDYHRSVFFEVEDPWTLDF